MINKVKEKKKSTTKVILSSSLAGWLLFNSFHMVDVKTDLKDPTKKVYIFNETPKLDACIADYATQKLSRKFY